jgi:hypothetical protein
VAKLDAAVLQKNLAQVERAAYWFGLLGRLSVMLGAAFVLLALMSWAGSEGVRGTWDDFVTRGVTAAGYGWLFLLGKKALEAVAAMISDLAAAQDG